MTRRWCAAIRPAKSCRTCSDTLARSSRKSGRILPIRPPGARPITNSTTPSASSVSSSGWKRCCAATVAASSSRSTDSVSRPGSSTRIHRFPAAISSSRSISSCRQRRPQRSRRACDSPTRTAISRTRPIRTPNGSGTNIGRAPGPWLCSTCATATCWPSPATRCTTTSSSSKGSRLASIWSTPRTRTVRWSTRPRPITSRLARP